MNYRHKHTEILNAQEGYDLVSQEYKNYHKHLDGFYDLDIQRFLPRDFENLEIIDLGAGDGRLFKYFENINFKNYIACDISKKLLDHHPEKGLKVKKIVCDLEKKLPFDDDFFDLAISFFVFEYIEDIQYLFGEIYRILKPGCRLIIGHFLQRREFERDIGKGGDKKRFKIKQYHHRIEEIGKAAEYNFFKFEYQEIMEKGNLVGYLIICDKE